MRRLWAVQELSLLRLDRIRVAQYVDFHGVCFPFDGLFELRFRTLWLGIPTHVGTQSTFWESRYLCSLHREPRCPGALHVMKTSNRKVISRLSAVVVALLLTHLALADPQTDSSGIIAHAWYQGYCDPPAPGAAPFCTLPHPYSGTFSIFTSAGKYVASASTGGLHASFTLALRPGRYHIMPDDPLLATATTTVIVRGHRYTEILIWIPPQ